MAIFEAGLGTKKKPSVTCRRYWEFHPLSADAVDGPAWVLWQALVYAWCGDRSRALEQLARLEKLRASSSPGHLSLVQSGMICAATRASKRSWPASPPRSRSNRNANDCDASEKNPETFRRASGEKKLERKILHKLNP